MKIRWISTIVLIVMFFAVTDISYCEDEQQCQPDVIVFLVMVLVIIGRLPIKTESYCSSG